MSVGRGHRGASAAGTSSSSQGGLGCDIVAATTGAFHREREGMVRRELVRVTFDYILIGLNRKKWTHEHPKEVFDVKLNGRGSGTSITMMGCDVGFFVRSNCTESMRFFF